MVSFCGGVAGLLRHLIEVSSGLIGVITPPARRIAW